MSQEQEMLMRRGDSRLEDVKVKGELVISFIHNNARHIVLDSTELFPSDTNKLRLYRVSKDKENGAARYCLVRRESRADVAVDRGAGRFWNEYFMVGEPAIKPGGIITDAAIIWMKFK